VECRLKRSFESSGVFGLVWFWRFCCVLAELDWDCEHVLDECLWWSDEGEDGQIGWPERGALASGVVSVFRVKFPSCCQHTKNNEDMQRHTHTHTHALPTTSGTRYWPSSDFYTLYTRTGYW